MILLDTCAILWDALEPKRLSRKALKAIMQAEAKGQLLIADISLWEIALLIEKKRVEIATAPAAFIALYLQARSIKVVPVNAEIAGLSVGFGSAINKDPADRLIVAAALAHKAILVTADQNLLACGLVETLW